MFIGLLLDGAYTLPIAGQFGSGGSYSGPNLIGDPPVYNDSGRGIPVLIPMPPADNLSGGGGRVYRRRRCLDDGIGYETS